MAETKHTIIESWPGLKEDLMSFLSDTDHVGSVLRALFGYTAAPSLLQLIFYLAFWVVLGFCALNQPDSQMARQPARQAEAR